MNRTIGLVGYACNGKSTLLSKLKEENTYYEFADLAAVYKKEASKNGFNGVTEWYTSVGLEKYKQDSIAAVKSYIDKLPTDKSLIIDDIFDYDILNYLLLKYPQIELISIHSKYDDRLKRLSKRTGMSSSEELIDGLNKRDNMKRYCGIEKVFLYSNSNIDNINDINYAYVKLLEKINKAQVICILGYSGSGKSTLNEQISEKLDITSFKYGNYIRKFVNQKGYSTSREFVKNEGIDEYINYTNSLMKIQLNNFIENNKLFLIDGLVSNEIYNYILSIHHVITIYLNTELKLREERIFNRENVKNKEAETNIKDTIKISNGLDMILSKCDYQLDGSKSIDDVYNDAIKVLKKGFRRK